MEIIILFARCADAGDFYSAAQLRRNAMIDCLWAIWRGIPGEREARMLKRAEGQTLEANISAIVRIADCGERGFLEDCVTTTG